MNTNYKSFKCPICNKKCVDLYVDTLSEKIISILPSSTEKIEIKDDLIAYCDSGIDLNLQKLVEGIKNHMSEKKLKEYCMIYKPIKQCDEGSKGNSQDSTHSNESTKKKSAEPNDKHITEILTVDEKALISPKNGQKSVPAKQPETIIMLD